MSKGIIKPEGAPLPENDAKQHECSPSPSLCQDSCGIQYNKKISAEQQQICKAFYELKDRALKTAYLTERVKLQPKVRERKREETKSGKRCNRTKNNIYEIVVDDSEVQVCQ